MKNFRARMTGDQGWQIAGAWMIYQLAYGLVYPFVPIYLSQERGIPFTTVSLIFPLMGLAVVLTPLLTGFFTDRWGRGVIIYSAIWGRCAIFMVLAILAYCSAPFWAFASLLMLNSAVGVMFRIGADAYLCDVVELAQRAVGYGKVRIGYSLGWALGPLLGAGLGTLPFWCFFMLAAVLCGVGFVYTRSICAPPWCRPPTSVSPVDRSALRGKKSGNIGQIIGRNPHLLGLLIGYLLISLLCTQLYSTMLIFATDRLQVTRRAMGLIYSLYSFVVMLLQQPCGIALARGCVPLKVQVLLGTMFYFCGFMLLIPCTGAWSVAGAALVIACGEIVLEPSAYASVSAETTPETTGRIISCYSLMRGIGNGGGSWLGAQIFHHTSSAAALWGILSSFAVAAAVIFAEPWSSQRRKLGNFSKSKTN